jgi:N-acetylmuramoyl-L-alanine amidase
MISRPSPNFDERDPAVPLHYIVLHYTGMKTADEALQRLCNPAAKVSAHYVIDEAGQAFHLVDESKRAWHAGKSFWRDITDINSASIGIELVNPGHEFGYVPFPEAQIEALKSLLTDIVKRHKLNPKTALLGHSDIAPDRKTDPGELFPWEELAKAGYGLWPKPAPEDRTSMTEADAQQFLRDIGYDPAAKSSLLAFQRHYDPKNLTGKPEPETTARLRALAAVMAAKGTHA